MITIFDPCSSFGEGCGGAGEAATGDVGAEGGPPPGGGGMAGLGPAAIHYPLPILESEDLALAALGRAFDAP